MMLNSKSIGNKIAQARKKINFSQAELARQVSISPQAVGKWERGESMPDISTLNRLAEIFGVDLNYFSTHFQSVGVETITFEPLEKQSGLLFHKQSKKPSWDMSKGNWVGADFSGIKNLQEKFGSSNMKNCKFIGSKMPELVLNSNNIERCDFSNSDISNAKFQSSYFFKTIFSECSLKNSLFSKCNIDNCNATGADFTGAEFKSTNLASNIIVNAVWSSTTFKDSSMANLVFEGILEDCSFENCSFSMVIFQNSKLINTFFKCKNLKRIQFIDCQVDRMTYEFLKNGKANLTGITLLP